MKQNNKDKYIEQLWKLVLDYEAGNIKYYRELKRQYTEEEWIQKREIIFEQLPKYAYIDRIYREEKLYDRLLQYTIESDGWCALQEYGSILAKEYPEQILEKYRYEINKMAVHTTNRKCYREMIAVLRHMQGIKGGKKVVSDIVAEWKEKYRTRRAMMDELSRL